jgi:hypothetical protein
MEGVPLRVSEVAGDYVPYLPDKDELPAESADFCLRFLDGATDEERKRGPALARRALELFTGAVAAEEDRYELVVTHSFLVAWFVRDAMQAPKWRWLGLNQGNAALTVIRYAPGRPASVLQRHAAPARRPALDGFPSRGAHLRPAPAFALGIWGPDASGQSTRSHRPLPSRAVPTVRSGRRSG